MRPTSRPAIATAWLALLLALGCARAEGEAGGSRLSESNFNKIRVGMTAQEVEAILGEPTEKGPILPSCACYWVWTEGEKEIAVLIDQSARVGGSPSRPAKYATNLP